LWAPTVSDWDSQDTKHLWLGLIGHELENRTQSAKGSIILSFEVHNCLATLASDNPYYEAWSHHPWSDYIWKEILHAHVNGVCQALMQQGISFCCVVCYVDGSNWNIMWPIEAWWKELRWLLVLEAAESGETKGLRCGFSTAWMESNITRIRIYMCGHGWRRCICSCGVVQYLVVMLSQFQHWLSAECLCICCWLCT